MLEDLKLELGIEEDKKDALLNRKLKKAVQKIVSITHQDEDYVTSELRETVIELAIVDYNRQGAEGLQSQSYSGVSESFESDIPNPIMRVLIAHRRLA